MTKIIVRILFLLATATTLAQSPTDTSKVEASSILIDTNTVLTNDSSVNINKPVKDINRSFLNTSTSDTTHSPRKATIYSALLPGLGQAYNGKHWKIGIIYGLEAFMIYQSISSHRLYKEHRHELFKRDLSASLDDGEIDWSITNEDLDIYTDATIETRKDLYKKKRDKYILFSILVYGLNIVDATVDAHLINFKTDNNSIVQLSPAIIPTNQSVSAGLNLNVRF